MRDLFEWDQTRSRPGTPAGRVVHRAPPTRRRSGHGLARALVATSLVAGSALAAPGATTALVVEGAYQQIGVTVRYDASYRRLGFPGGDVPADRGVCTDVVVRAYRHAGFDLQLLVNQDMARDFKAYPQLWKMARPDRNIDHRRVPNLATYFTRHGTALSLANDPADYLPGDLVTWRLASGVPHIGIVSDQASDGRPLVIHNIGQGTRLEDVLFAYTLTGHYRYAP